MMTSDMYQTNQKQQKDLYQNQNKMIMVYEPRNFIVPYYRKRWPNLLN
jgi:hypothetical protein